MPNGISIPNCTLSRREFNLPSRSRERHRISMYQNLSTAIQQTGSIPLATSLLAIFLRYYCTLFEDLYNREIGMSHLIHNVQPHPVIT